MDSSLEVHVFGANEGECVVLRLPDGKWGVIDSLLDSPSSTTKFPVTRFLIDRKVSSLAFVLLTHPHADHYLGMRAILNAFSVERFWRSAAMTPPRLRQIVNLAISESVATGLPSLSSEAGELCSLFDDVRILKDEKKTIVENAGRNTQIYPFGIESGDFRITALGPIGAAVEKYEESLAKCFDSSGTYTGSLKHSLHNTISAPILIRYGTTRVLLGADTDRPSWEEILKDHRQDLSDVHLVKASHHGSTTGYCDGLWECFSASKKPIAVLTRYRRSRLPREEGLNHIAKFSQKVVCAAKSSAGSIPLNPSVHPSSRVALFKHFKVWSTSESHLGMCSFVFDNQGQVVQEDCSKATMLAETL